MLNVSTVKCCSNQAKSTLENNTKVSTKKIVEHTIGFVPELVCPSAILYSLNSSKIQYLNNLAQGLSKELGVNISPEQLSFVMTKEELLTELPKLKEENYVASEYNLENGIFQADLHSHSNNSDGRISVETILDEAAKYGDQLNSINGKSFILAITDHDGINGVKEALKIIVHNPNKYKNIKFIPAAELSFIIPSDEDSERYAMYKHASQFPELLIYGINPYSKNTQDFFDNVYQKRKQKITDAFNLARKLHPGYTYDENRFNPKQIYFMYTQNFRLYNYLRMETILQSFAEQYGNKQEFIDNYYSFLNKFRCYSNLSSLIYYTEMEKLNFKIPAHDMELEELIYPKHKSLDEIDNKYEKSFFDIVRYADKENAVLGFAHPVYTIQNFGEDNKFEKMKHLIEVSNGRLLMSEHYHQAYQIGRDIFSKEELDRYNQILDELNLLKFGGRDNHEPIFLRLQ